MVWGLIYKTTELIIYVSVQVYAEIGAYLITCPLYFCINDQCPIAERWARLFIQKGIIGKAIHRYW